MNNMQDDPKLPARWENEQPIEVITQPVSGGLSVGGGAEEHEGGGISLTELLQYRWSMLLVFLVIAGSALPVIWSTTEPEFRGEALIQVKPTQEVLVYQTPQIGYGSYWSFMMTQVGIITSPDILKRVVSRDDIQATEWYRTPPESVMNKLRGAPSPHERLRDMLQVAPDGDSQHILIAAMTLKAEEAPLICNAVAEEYLDFILRQNEESGERNLASLRAKEVELKSELGDLNRRVSALAAELGTSNPDDLVTQQRLQLDRLEDDVNNKKFEIASAQAKLAAMVEAGEIVEPVDPGKPRSFEADHVWQGLVEDLRKAETELKSARRRFGASNPELAAYQDAVQSAQQRLTQRETYLRENPRSAAPPPMPRASAGDDKLAMSRLNANEMKRYVRDLQLELEPLVERVESYRASSNAMFEKAQAFNELNQSLERKNEHYNDVRIALNRRETERDAPNRITLAAPAVVPARAFKDNRIKLSFAAIAGALIAAFGLGFIRVRMNSSIQNYEDVVELRPLPTLGHLSSAKKAPRKAEEAIAQLDQVRMLRTTLLRRLQSGRGSVIQITSAGPRSGKTSTSLALAQSLRDCGRSVMLVDTDFRNPSVAPRLECPQTPGLMELLRGQVEEREVLQDIDGITVVPAGIQNGVQAADMLAKNSLIERFERWRQDYELIILDGAPLLTSADAAIIAPQIDGNVLVVREKHCRRDEVLSALQRIESAGGEMLGLIVIGKQKLTNYGYPSYGKQS